MTKMELSRRAFIVTAAAAGGGMALGFFMPGRADAATRIGAKPWATPTDKSGAEINAWIVIGPDNTVTLRCAQSEMGEGVFTSMPMIVAEELQCDWKLVVAEYASANRSIRENNVYQRMATNGSGAVRLSRVYLQQAGASARERLREAAAQAWGVPRDQVVAENSMLRAGNRSATYGEFANRAAQIKLAEEPKIKTPEQFKLLGTSVPRLDVPLKVNGSAIYGIDVQLPGMVYATSKVAPVAGGRIKSMDVNAVRTLPGVLKVVEFGKDSRSARALRHGVAVVADTWWHAKTALDRLPIEWEMGDGTKFSSTAMMQSDLAALNGREGAVAAKSGDLDAAMKAAAKTVEAVYSYPMQAHATMEPLNATAQVTADRVDVWLGTQDPTGALAEAAQASGVKPENCFVNNCFLGGGYGGRGSRTEVSQAVVVAKEMGGRPVQMLWTRETDMTTDYYNPAVMAKFQAGLGPNGMPTAWFNRVIGDSIFGWIRPDAVANGVDSIALGGLANFGYKVQNQRIEYILRNTNTPVSFWRAPGTNFNVFMIESFTDELAVAAGKDPVEFRRAMLTDLPEWLNVLNVAVKNSDWGKPLARGEGRGVAICEAHGTLNCSIAEVSVTRRGQVTINRIDTSVDPGHIINPLTAAEQTEGAIIYGLSAAMKGAITLKDGAIEQKNYDNYPTLRIGDMPTIRMHLALSGGQKWGGMGESTLPSGVAAVANAIYSATGKRVRSIPFQSNDLTWG